jgi:hypothetical protein
MANLIQIRRNTIDSSVPTDLLTGELAYVEQTDTLYIGTSDSVEIVKPEFLTFAESNSPDEIILEDSGDKKYTLSVSDTLASNVEYILPTDLPDSEKILVCTDINTGQLDYGEVTIEVLSDIGNVSDTVVGDQILIFENDEWVAKSPSDLLEDLNLDVTSNQEYENLHLSGNITVKGDSVQLNSSNLAIGDKMIGIGVSGDTEILQDCTIAANGVVSITIPAGSVIAGNDQVFIGNDNTNIPTSYYTLNSAGTSFTITGYVDDAVTTPFDLVVSKPSTDAQIDGAGLIFPGLTEKSLKWIEKSNNVVNKHFKLTGGDLKVSGHEIHLNDEKLIDNDDEGKKTISGVNITSSQVTGVFDGGTFE